MSAYTFIAFLLENFEMCYFMVSFFVCILDLSLNSSSLNSKDAPGGRPSDTLQSNPPYQAKILQSNPPQAEKTSLCLVLKGVENFFRRFDAKNPPFTIYFRVLLRFMHYWSHCGPF